MTRTITYLFIVAALLSILVGEVLALTDEEVYRTLNFNFITPGARALGFGGAFIALADDATAAEANPAGFIWIRNQCSPHTELNFFIRSGTHDIYRPYRKFQKQLQSYHDRID